jgi:hypothetical protein
MKLGHGWSQRGQPGVLLDVEQDDQGFAEQPLPF